MWGRVMIDESFGEGGRSHMGRGVCKTHISEKVVALPAWQSMRQKQQEQAGATAAASISSSSPSSSPPPTTSQLACPGGMPHY